MVNEIQFFNGGILPKTLFKFGSNWASDWLIFLAISRGRISREKCLANPFFVLARNARNVHVYMALKEP